MIVWARVPRTAEDDVMVPSFWMTMDRWAKKLLRVCSTWVVVKIMVPLWVLSTIRHLVFWGPRRGP